MNLPYPNVQVDVQIAVRARQSRQTIEGLQRCVHDQSQCESPVGTQSEQSDRPDPTRAICSAARSTPSTTTLLYALTAWRFLPKINTYLSPYITTRFVLSITVFFFNSL